MTRDYEQIGFLEVVYIKINYMHDFCENSLLISSMFFLSFRGFRFN